MGEAAKVQDLKTSDNFGKATGRITKIQEYKAKDGSKMFEHMLVTKAKDEYSQPGQVIIHSSRKIEEIGAVTTVSFEAKSWYRKHNDNNFDHTRLYEIL